MMVIDASVAVKWFVDEPNSEEARSYKATWRNELKVQKLKLISPVFVALEVQHAVSRRYNRGQVSFDMMRAVGETLRLDIDLIPLESELTAVASAMSIHAYSYPASRPETGFAGRIRPFNVYDCLYIALAAQEKVALLTADAEQAAIATKFSVESNLLAA